MKALLSAMLASATALLTSARQTAQRLPVEEGLEATIAVWVVEQRTILHEVQVVAGEVVEIHRR